MDRKAGAPKGGRVHWLILNLPSEFKGKYLLAYQYRFHQYTFYRMNGRRLHDCFIVKRTSKKYFRAVYVNVTHNKIEFFGHKKSEVIAEKMVKFYKEDKEREVL